MRPAGLSRTKRSHRVSVFLVPLIVSLSAVLLLAGAGPAAQAAPTPSAAPAKKPAAPVTAVAAPSHSGGVRHSSSGRHHYYRRRYAWHRRYRGTAAHTAVAVAAKPVKPAAVMARPAAAAAAATAATAVKPVLVSARLSGGSVKAPAGGAAAANAVAHLPMTTAGGRHYYSRRRRRGYTHRAHVASMPTAAVAGYSSTAAALAAPMITPGGNLVEPLSNGLTFTMPRALLLARYGQPQEQVGAQMRYANFGVEYLPNSDRVNFVALQHDVRLNGKIGTGSAKAEVEKAFGKLNARDEVVYQKYKLHFSFTPDGHVELITVSPASGHSGF